MRNTLLLSGLFFVCTCDAANSHLHFIRLDLEANKIELGDLSTRGDQVAVAEIDPENEQASAEFANYLKDRIAPDDFASALFFIHCMWGSNPLFVRYEAIQFDMKYLSVPASPVQELFYIIWDTSAPTYSGNRNNALASSKLLSHLFDYMQEVSPNDFAGFNIMCHSMGNKLFVETIREHHYNKLFDHIILAAADVNKKTFYSAQVQQNLSDAGRSIAVLYNSNDFALRLSRIRNFYQPLGLDPDDNKPANCTIQFIDCSFLPDNKLLQGSITGHLYYCSSDTARNSILQFLNS